MLFFSLALAAPPDKIAAKIDTGGSGDVDALAISSDGEIVVGITRSETDFFVLEIDSWTMTSLLQKPCTVASVAVAPVGGTTYTVAVGCNDGTVTTYTYDTSASAADRLLRNGDDAGAYSWPIASNGGSIKALWWDGKTDPAYFYAFEDGTTNGYLHVFDENGNTDGDLLSTYPMISGYTGYSDAITNFDVGTDGIAYLAHGGTRISSINFASGVYTNQPLTGAGYGYDDLGAGLLFNWAVDTDLSLLVQLDASTGILQGTYPTVSSPKAVVEGGTLTEQWLLVSGDGLRIHQMVNGSISDLNDPYYVNDSAEINIQDAVANSQYAFGGGEAGKLQVITNKPWIHDGATVEPATATAGDVVSVVFNVDEDCDWQVCLNGTRASCDDELGSGQVTGVDEDELDTPGALDAVAEVEVEVTTDFREGTNYFYVLATDAAGNIGHRRLELVVDNPPTTPTLTSGSLGFADEALILSFDGIEDEDLAEYDIYISDVPFTRADFDEPGFVPEDPSIEGGPENPITISSTGGQSVSTTISPLANSVTYYVAVRARDEGGLESEMSNVVSGTPEQTYTASQLAGETGGGPCSTGATGPVFWGALGGLFGLFARRRRTGGPALARRVGVALGILAVSSPALADEEEKSGDITKQYGNFELRYGGFLNLQDQAITTVFGGGHNMLQVEAGPQITRFFEVDLEAGFYQELGTTVTADGAASAKRTMLTMYPLGLSVSGRVHIIDEQIIVPYGRYGVDLVYWIEHTDNNSGGKTKVQGTKVGHHFALGAGLLLDIFAPRRASLLEAYSGINDTYITVEFRRQMIDSRAHPWAAADTTGFSFTGNMLTVGLKLDY